ncbi:MAG: hypothetical protein ABIP41_05920 [Croceibacterium sp.]
MFEGKAPVSTAPACETLRPLAWAELASRLAVARDLRASLSLAEADGEASFDAMSARWIAAHQGGEQPVNLEDSGNGKSVRSNGAGAPPTSLGGAVREA